MKYHYKAQSKMAMRGRPVGSQIRQNIIEILFFIKEAHGYRIHKIYEECFHQVHIESIYYHLKKGIKEGEFELSQVKIDQGNYSWGTEVRKFMYKLGEHAHPKIIPELHDQIKVFIENEDKKK
jgi:hypothetical protein